MISDHQAHHHPHIIPPSLPVKFKMLGFKAIIGAALLARGVLGEGVHLLNCRPFGAAGSSQTWLSIVAVRTWTKPSDFDIPVQGKLTMSRCF
jgi:hypothetical protein